MEVLLMVRLLLIDQLMSCGRGRDYNAVDQATATKDPEVA
jgi:hypothetical protein